jgi:hypothetical protein
VAKVKVCSDVTPCLLVIRHRYGLWASRKVETVRFSGKWQLPVNMTCFTRFLYSEIILLVLVLTDKLFHLLSGFKVGHF